jgi:hypothetical protein
LGNKREILDVLFSVFDTVDGLPLGVARNQSSIRHATAWPIALVGFIIPVVKTCKKWAWDLEKVKVGIMLEEKYGQELELLKGRHERVRPSSLGSEC